MKDKLKDSPQGLTQHAGTARILWRFLEHKGINPQPIYAEAGISEDLLHSGRARLRVEQMDRVWQRVLALNDDPCFALQFPQFWRPGDLSVLDHAWLASATLEEALSTLVRYFAIVDQSGLLQLKKTRKGMILLGQPPVMGLKDYSQLREGFMVLVVYMSRLIAGSELAPVQVTLRNPTQDCKQCYQTWFRCPVQFSAVADSILFSLEDVQRPLMAANAEVAQAIAGIIAHELTLLRTEGITGQVQSALVKAMPSGRVGINAIAASLAFSPRELQRRLRAAGSSFRKEIDLTRHTLASRYLSDPSLSLIEITFLLAFSEQSALTRACKRWFGLPPSELRSRDCFQ